MSALADMLFQQARDLNEQRRLGMDFMREEARRDFASLVSAYERAKLDPNAKIPTMLYLAIENLKQKYAR